MAATKSAAIAATESGDTEVLAAQGDGKAVSFRYVFVTETDVDIKFKSGSNDLTGAMAAGVNGRVTSPIWLHGNANEAININLSGAGNVNGHIEYEINDVG